MAIEFLEMIINVNSFNMNKISKWKNTEEKYL